MWGLHKSDTDMRELEVGTQVLREMVVRTTDL